VLPFVLPLVLQAVLQGASGAAHIGGGYLAASCFTRRLYSSSRCWNITYASAGRVSGVAINWNETQGHRES
jgi:hypothetical protein